MNRFS